VPKFGEATLRVQRADVVVVVGTSLQVYPAADLLEYCKNGAAVYIIDPDEDIVIPTLSIGNPSFIEHIKKPATEGLRALEAKLRGKAALPRI
jgi:NAD-dependent deacetylase